MTAIQYAKGEKQRLSPYKDLLKVTQKTIGYAIKAEEIIGGRRHGQATRKPPFDIHTALGIFQMDSHDSPIN